MIEGLKPYAEYKESGLPWIGRVPGDWRVERTKWIFRSRKELNVGRRNTNALSLTLRGVVNNDPESPEGMVPKDYATYQLFRKHDLVFKLIDLENIRTSRVGLVHEDGIMSSAYVRLAPSKSVNIRFFYFQFFDLYTRAVFNALGAGVRSTLGATDLGELRIAVPPPDEQAAIVRFLDHANRKIDGFIRAKRKLIGLLNEQKQAIIHRAVTGKDEVRMVKDENGNSSFILQPSTLPKKPSGIPWLGDIPMHWEVRRVKQATRILRGKFSHRPRNDPSFYDGPYPFIQTGSVAQADKFITSYKQTLNEKGLSVSKLFPSGTLVMTIAANIGDVAILTFEACFPDSIVGFVPKGPLDRDYLYFVFLCMKGELLREAPVNTQGNLNVERIGTMWMPLPPLSEQEQITKHIERDTEPLNTAIARTEREIALMQEYRTRLTADLVTGKLDVREAAAKLPDLPTDTSAAPDEPLEENEPEEAEL
jgi:type I restriction enzyme S subunit